MAQRSKTCPHCNKEFIPRANNIYCGEKCWKAEKKAKPKNCVNCQCWFTPVKLMATGKYISHNGGKTCSAECHIAWIKNNEERKVKIGNAFRGDKHPNWQGGKSLLNSTSKRGPNWPKQRAKAIDRDKACVDCGISAADCVAKFKRSLDVDHVVPFHNFGSYLKANALSNLQCRCASCHRIAEAKRSMIQMVLPLQDNPRRGHQPKKSASGRANFK